MTCSMWPKIPALVAAAVLLAGCGPKETPVEAPARPVRAAPTTPATASAPQQPAQLQELTKGNAQQDWPAFRGPNADGMATFTGINKAWTQRAPRRLWRFGLGDKGYAGPSVAQGMVFIIDHKGDKDIVRALNLQTGKAVWQYAYADTSSHNYGFARATPTYSEGRLYTLSRLGLLHCLEASSGRMIWSRNLVSEFGGKRPQWDYAASPLVDGSKLIVCPGGQTGIAALDKTSGQTLWTGGVGGLAGYATPVLATLNGRKQYVVFAGQALYGADADSGRTLWQTPWKTNYDVNAATPIVAEGYVFVTSGYSVGCGLFEIVSSRAKPVWANKDLQSHFNSPIYCGGYLYGIGDPGNLVCINPSGGAVIWRQSGFEKGGLVYVDGTLIAMDGKGGDVVMVAANASSYQELGRFRPLGGQSWTAPIAAQGKLLIRNTQTLACFDLM